MAKPPLNGPKRITSSPNASLQKAASKFKLRAPRATADVRGTYANLPPAHQLALHVLTNGQYGIIGQNERRQFASTLGATTASRKKKKKITEDSVFWQPGRMGNRRGRVLPYYTQRF